MILVNQKTEGTNVRLELQTAQIVKTHDDGQTIDVEYRLIGGVYLETGHQYYGLPVTLTLSSIEEIMSEDTKAKIAAEVVQRVRTKTTH